jgi:hypothetical protein
MTQQPTTLVDGHVGAPPPPTHTPSVTVPAPMDPELDPPELEPVPPELELEPVPVVPHCEPQFVDWHDSNAADACSHDWDSVQPVRHWVLSHEQAAMQLMKDAQAPPPQTSPDCQPDPYAFVPCCPHIDSVHWVQVSLDAICAIGFSVAQAKEHDPPFLELLHAAAAIAATTVAIVIPETTRHPFMSSLPSIGNTRGRPQSHRTTLLSRVRENPPRGNRERARALQRRTRAVASWSHPRESNSRPTVYETVALPLS